MQTFLTIRAGFGSLCYGEYAISGWVDDRFWDQALAFIARIPPDLPIKIRVERNR